METNMYHIGVEREGLRCTKGGDLSELPHPRVFGNRNTNLFVTTDFGEAQMELRTPVCNSTEECYEKLENITNVVINELSSENELLWPYSMPCILPNVENFKFGDYKENQKEHEYEMALFRKYGLEMYCMSGIHVNFSIDKNFYKQIQKLNKKLPENMDDAYFKIIRNYIKKVWILIYLFGATPKQYGENSYKCECSIRNSYKQGFKNNKLIDISYENKKSHIDSIEANIKAGNISALRELYIPIRIKGIEKNNINQLRNEDIDRVEVRVCDLNPFDKCSISKEQLDFITAFLFYCLLTEEDDYSEDYRKVAENGITKEQQEIIKQEIEKIIKINKKYALGFEKSLKNIQMQFQTGINDSQKIRKIIDEKGYINGLVELAKKYEEDANNLKYSIRYKNNIITSATSALIQDAISQGIDYKIIDYRDYDCFVEFNNGKRKEYVIGATQTKKDKYIVPFMTEDKYFAKHLMEEHKIYVPEGIMINKNTSKRTLETIYKKYYNKPVVIKPRKTNGGTGITVYSNPISSAQLHRAIKHAFQFDEDVLVEEYIEGQEYRFIIIDGKCASVVLRRSARIIGNGKNTIKELIEIKDKEPWHYLLNNRMKIDVPLKIFLKHQNLTLEHIPKNGEIIYLRENSNCSTGGESINVTDLIPQKFKKQAEKAAKVFESHICGVDMIIHNLKRKKYAILEVNTDPGYDINEWPYEGEKSRIGLQILKMLKLVDRGEI